MNSQERKIKQKEMSKIEQLTQMAKYQLMRN